MQIHLVISCRSWHISCMLWSTKLYKMCWKHFGELSCRRISIRNNLKCDIFSFQLSREILSLHFERGLLQCEHLYVVVGGDNLLRRDTEDPSSTYNDHIQWFVSEKRYRMSRSKFMNVTLAVFCICVMILYWTNLTCYKLSDWMFIE